MKCPYCGADNPEENKYCGACGKELVTDPEAARKPRGRVCSSCGRSLPMETNVCPYCGRWVSRTL